MNWFTLTIISAITYAIAEIISKYVSDKKSEPVFIGIIAAFFTTLVSFQFASLEPMRLPTNVWALTGLVLSAMCIAIGIVTYYEGLKHSDVSEFGLFSRSRTLFVVLGGMVLFRERFNALQIIGGLLIVYSIFILSWEGGRIYFGKGSKFAIATAVLFGIGALIDKAVISYYSAIMYTFLTYLLTVAFMFPLAVSRYIEGVKLPKVSTTGILFIVGTFYGISAYCIYAAYSLNGPISLITLASQFEIPITVLWGIYIMKEQKRVVPKLMSMALLIMGIVLLK
ncbi:MAG: DMT family transporter [Patescibacteria group bacterium]